MRCARGPASTTRQEGPLSGPSKWDDVYAAREELILSRRTHLDQLAHKLEGGAGAAGRRAPPERREVRHQARDLEYVRDLGLLAPDSPPRIANPIYREVVPRELGYVLQDSLDVQVGVVRGRRWPPGHGQAAEGVRHVLRGARPSTGWGASATTPKAGPQLILQSYLQRVVNGGGPHRERESTAWDVAGRTCWCCGRVRRVSRRTCGTVRGRVQGAAGLGPQGAWNGPSSGAWSRRWGIRRSAGRRKGIWW